MARTKQRPARQSVKTKYGVAHMQITPEGDIYFVAPSAYILQVHTWADGKTSAIEAPTTKSIALLGDRLLAAGSFDFEQQREHAVVVERDSGKVTARLDTKGGAMTSIDSVEASADGNLVAVSFGYPGGRCGIELFGRDGGHVQSIKLGYPAGGVFFSRDSKTLNYFSDNALHRMPVGGKKASSVKCKVEDKRDARVTRQGAYVLVQSAGYGHQFGSYVVEEKSGKLVFKVPEAECTSWGPAEGTIVWCTGDQVNLLDLKGKKLGSFKRDRATRLEHAAPSPHGFWIGGGRFLEIYDFNQMKEVATSSPGPRKERAAPRPPEILKPKKGEAEAGEALRLAIWKNPEDRDALRVYADWLAEQGSARGEYIQLRCLDKPSAEQEDAAQRLLKKHRGEWLGAARPFVRSWSDSWRLPGFVDRVWCEAVKFIEGFEHLIKLGPRLMVTVTSMRSKRRETEARMAALPLGTLWSLDLSANAMDDKGLATLAPAMKGLRSLDLQGNEITGQGLRTLGAQVDTLQYLCISPQVALRGADRTAAVDDYARAILETPGFKSLVHIHFPSLSPSDGWKRKLRKLPKLKNLNTDGYAAGDGLTED